RLAIPASRALRVRRQGLRPRCRNVTMGRAGNGSRGSIGGADPHPLLPGNRGHLGRRPLGLIALCAVAAWLIAFITWSNGPWGYDFIALYSAARLVATGHAADVTDLPSLIAMERSVQPEARLNDPNLPALALLMAPLGALRAPAFWSGTLLGLTLFRPQLFPLFALVALFDRRRAAGLLCAVAIIALASLAIVGIDGMARYPHLLSITATELLPPELGLP